MCKDGEPDYYGQILERLDAFFAATRARHPACFACQPGCAACCQHLTLFPVEADPVRQAIAALPPEVRRLVLEQAEALLGVGEDLEGPCPLLVDHRCAIYESRPVICRSHGLPIRVEEEGEMYLDTCPLNFALPGALDTLPSESILDLERINELLVAVNAYHSRRAGVDPGGRLCVAEIILSVRLPLP